MVARPRPMQLHHLPQELFECILEYYVASVSVREATRATRVNRRFHQELPPVLIRCRCIIEQKRYPFYDYPLSLVTRVIQHEMHEGNLLAPKILYAIHATVAALDPALDPSTPTPAFHALESSLCAAFIRHHSIDRLLSQLHAGKKYECNEPFWEHDAKTNPLAAAAAIGDCTALRRILARGVDLTKRSPLFGNPLVAAASANQVEALRLLSDVSIESTELKPWYHPCLCQAAYLGCADAVRFLLSPHFHNIQGDKIVWQKATSSLLSFFPGGLKLHPAAAANLSLGPPYSEAFECACFGGNDLEIHRLLLDRLDRRHRKASLDRGLIRACQMGHFEVAKFLIQAGASIDSADRRENHLTWAIQSGSNKLVRLLLDHGADPNSEAIPLFGCPLQFAARSNDPRLVEMLLDYGADPSGRRAATQRPQTVLSIAAWEGKLAAIQVLVDRGADLHVDDNGLLALCCAARGGHADVVRYLIKCGIDVNAIFESLGEARQSPLGAALAGSKSDLIVPILVNHGASVQTWIAPDTFA